MPKTPPHFDDLEIRDPKQREHELLRALRAQIDLVKAKSSTYARQLAEIESSSIGELSDFARLPLTKKADLKLMQKGSPPFGGLTTVPVSELARVFVSPGPIYEPQGQQEDFWRMARAMFAAGIRKGDLVYNTFSYHLTPAGAMMEAGARALGCPVVAGGTGQTELQARTIADLKPAAYVGTPSFLRLLREKAQEIGVRINCIKNALVSGEALPETVRSEFLACDITATQCYGTADVGLIAYETRPGEGMVVDEGVYLEVVTPGTGDLVAPGEVGELLVTVINPVYPLIRFATGDLSALMPGISPCGRTNVRIKGWMGRADQTTKIKGMFVHPEQIAEIVKRHPEIDRARLVVTNPDHVDKMVLHCELGGSQPEGMEDRIRGSIREVTKLSGKVKTVSIGTLANDGRIIDDQRIYD